MTTEGAVQLSIADGVAAVLFDRPQARNAMTWAMYQQLRAICEKLAADRSVRVVTFRGAGGEAFVAGTDIAQFAAFQTGDDGVAYERQIDYSISLVESLPMPTVAVLEGWTIGGGLAIATACDFRIATSASRFGVPIAKTLGNCLSIANLARLVAVWGMPRVKRMLLLAELIHADEALACGAVLQVCAPEARGPAETRGGLGLCGRAPVPHAVTMAGWRRLAVQGLPEGEDLIRRCYGSADFHEGVAAFVAKQSPHWTGC
ncbi:MAG: enoyl-CoA hydratase/isomerase family protein [Polaromonas sp.]|nr:enoyl-CoA hydratase/isomerase family protein [Polaromonas sp.]